MNKFWENRSKTKFNYSNSFSNLVNDEKLSLEKHHIEEKMLDDFFNNKKFKHALDLGCGNGQWFSVLSNVSDLYTGVDLYASNFPYIKKDKSFFYKEDATSYLPRDNTYYDLVFISGLLLYLDDKKFLKTLRNIKKFISKDGLLILREPVGIYERYEIKNKFSQELSTNYSAINRTEEEFKKNFKIQNFEYVYSYWFHKENSKFNKWKETRLKFLVFKNN